MSRQGRFLRREPALVYTTLWVRRAVLLLVEKGNSHRYIYRVTWKMEEKVNAVILFSFKGNLRCSLFSGSSLRI